VSRDEDHKELKVTDRRMFTPDGELRVQEELSDESAAGVEVEEAAAGKSSGVQEVEEKESDFEVEAAQVPGGDPEASTDNEPPTLHGSLPEPGFADLVSILAEPIPLFLGDVPLPDGKSAENLELARFHIDLLDVLRRKTEGNLSQEERAVLEDLLYRLRMRYVQKRG
jgi:hypothetical protein